jgi:hypothetical protein
MKVAPVFRLRNRRGEVTEIKEGGFGNIIAETKGACVIAITWPNQKVGMNNMGLKDRYDQHVNRLLRGRQEGQIGHVSSIIR